MVQLILIFVLFSCTLFSYFLNRLLVKSVTNPGVSAKMQDSDARWAAKTKPTVGGLSFYITFILAALVLFVSNAGISDFSHEFLGLVIVSTLGFLLGLQDDAYSTRPLLKLSGQILCGVIMVFFGVQINLFHVPVIDAFLTVFWVVGIMNAVNLLDNMDGVTGSISLIIVATVVVLMATFGVQNSPMFYSLVAVGGAIFGFLFLNWIPSKLYMGDTGSQFLGTLTRAH